MSSWRSFIIYQIFSLIPATRMFALKRFLLRWAGARVGSDVRIVSSARFLLTGHLSIGDGSWIGHEVLVVGGNANVTIGSGVDVGPRATLATGTHEPFSSLDKAAGAGYSLAITIGDGAWIGTNATLLGGSNVGKCAIIAAGAMVKDYVPERSIVGGVPARQLKTLIAAPSK